MGIVNFSIVWEWLIKEKSAKWHSAMPPPSLRVMCGSYYRADKYYEEMELFTANAGEDPPSIPARTKVRALRQFIISQKNQYMQQQQQVEFYYY